MRTLARWIAATLACAIAWTSPGTDAFAQAVEVLGARGGAPAIPAVPSLAGPASPAGANAFLSPGLGPGLPSSLWLAPAPRSQGTFGPAPEAAAGLVALPPAAAGLAAAPALPAPALAASRQAGAVGIAPALAAGTPLSEKAALVLGAAASGAAPAPEPAAAPGAAEARKAALDVWFDASARGVAAPGDPVPASLGGWAAAPRLARPAPPPGRGSTAAGRGIAAGPPSDEEGYFDPALFAAVFAPFGAYVAAWLGKTFVTREGARWRALLRETVERPDSVEQGSDGATRYSRARRSTDEKGRERVDRFTVAVERGRRARWLDRKHVRVELEREGFGGPGAASRPQREPSSPQPGASAKTMVRLAFDYGGSFRGGWRSARVSGPGGGPAREVRSRLRADLPRGKAAAAALRAYWLPPSTAPAWGYGLFLGLLTSALGFIAGFAAFAHPFAPFAVIAAAFAAAYALDALAYRFLPPAKARVWGEAGTALTSAAAWLAAGFPGMVVALVGALSGNAVHRLGLSADARSPLPNGRRRRKAALAAVAAALFLGLAASSAYLPAPVSAGERERIAATLAADPAGAAHAKRLREAKGLPVYLEQPWHFALGERDYLGQHQPGLSVAGVDLTPNKLRLNGTLPGPGDAARAGERLAPTVLHELDHDVQHAEAPGPYVLDNEVRAWDLQARYILGRLAADPHAFDPDGGPGDALKRKYVLQAEAWLAGPGSFAAYVASAYDVESIAGRAAAGDPVPAAQAAYYARHRADMEAAWKRLSADQAVTAAAKAAAARHRAGERRDWPKGWAAPDGLKARLLGAWGAVLLALGGPGALLLRLLRRRGRAAPPGPPRAPRLAGWVLGSALGLAVVAPGLVAAAWAASAALLALASWSDAGKGRVARRLLDALLLAGLLAAWANPLLPALGLAAVAGPFFAHAAASILGAAAGLALSGLVSRAGRRALGPADLRAAAAIGAWTGPFGVAAVLAVALASAFISWGALRLAGDRRGRIAFLPWLALAAALYIAGVSAL